MCDENESFSDQAHPRRGDEDPSNFWSVCNIFIYLFFKLSVIFWAFGS